MLPNLCCVEKKILAHYGLIKNVLANESDLNKYSGQSEKPSTPPPWKYNGRSLIYST